MIEVPKIANALELVGVLDSIGRLKIDLPFHLRDWVNIAGLYVQRRSAGGWVRLEAGGKFRACFDALTRTEVPLDASDWEIRRFDQETWQRRFAHLVWPTWEIVLFVSGSDITKKAGSQFDKNAATTLEQVVRHFKTTGEWLGLLHNKCASCAREVTIWQWQGVLCPHCGRNLRHPKFET